MKQNMAEVNMILAGDVGGTKTLLGLFAPAGPALTRIVVREFRTTDFSDLTSMISAFAADDAANGQQVRAAGFGVAGPVLGRTAELTNVSFRIDADEIGKAFDIPRVVLVNDLVAVAHAVRALRPDDVTTLQPGLDTNGNMAVIAAGTGLGEALIVNLDGRLVPSPTEGGHADWAPRNDAQIAVLRGLIDRFGRAEVEHVVSGLGLANIHPLAHDHPCAVVADPEAPDAPASISQAAMERRCQGCMNTLAIFVDAYGAEAGNLALRSLATGGIFVAGGIAPKILPALTDGRFMSAFLDKGSFRSMLERIPVRVILDTDAGLIGAAAAAAHTPTH
jgi:glucokinase